MSAGNKRNSRTTHPRKAKRRATALENFTVKRNRIGEAAYMARKLAEYMALGGSADQLQYVPQRLGSAV